MPNLAMKLCVASIIIWLVLSGASFAEVAMITECSQPYGMSLDLKPQTKAWHDVILEKTTISFIRMRMGNYGIIIKDRHGDIAIKSHDPDVRKVYEDDANLTIISAPPIGMVETFQLSTLGCGQRVAAWNIMKNNTLPHKETLVRTYVFKCEDR